MNMPVQIMCFAKTATYNKIATEHKHSFVKVALNRVNTKVINILLIYNHLLIVFVAVENNKE